MGTTTAGLASALKSATVNSTKTPTPATPSSDPFCIVWSPTSDKAPSRTMTRAQANTVAEKMAKEHPGSIFYVMEAAQVSVVNVTTTKY
jgi:hypothetical protein